MFKMGYTLLPSLFFLAGCPVGKPTEQTISRIEQRLSDDPCLKDIRKMHRTYAFAIRGWEIDPNKIDVDIEPPGYDGLPLGRFAAEPTRSNWIDDRNRFSASATYVVSLNELDLWHCGDTWSGIRHLPRH